MRRSTPLALVLKASGLGSSYESSKTRPHFLDAAQLLIGRGARLSVEEESKEGFDLPWMVQVLGKGTELPDRRAAIENPLVWRIMTANFGDPVSADISATEQSHPELLSRATTTYGTPLHAAILRGSDCQRCDSDLVANGAELSESERKVPRLAAHVEGILASSETRSMYEKSLRRHSEANRPANYRLFNMSEERYYTFRPGLGVIGKLFGRGVRFFALDSNYMDKAQLDWLEKELAGSGSDWKICFFHHPLCSSARKHGSSRDLRARLEPLFVRYGVSVVFAGHDHVYERIKPQQGIAHFVSGAGGSLRRGDLRKTELTAVGYDQDFHFMLAEIDGDEMHFQAITRTGKTVDSAVVQRVGAPAAASSR